MSDSPENPEELVKQEGSKKTKKSKKGCLFFVLLLFLGAGAILGYGWWHREVLAEKIMVKVDEVLKQNGIYLSFGEKDFSLKRGLVLKDVELFQDETKENAWLKLSDVSLKVGFKDVLQGNWRGTLGLEESRLDVIGPKRTLWMKDVDGKVRGGAEEIVIQSFNGDLLGWDLDASGGFKLPVASEGKVVKKEETEAKKTEPRKPTKAMNLGWVDATVEWLEVKAGGQAPKLKVKVEDGKEGTALPLFVMLEGSGKDFVWKKTQLQELAFKGDFDGEKVQYHLEKLAAFEGSGDAKGMVDLKAEVLKVDQSRVEYNYVELLKSPLIGLQALPEALHLETSPPLLINDFSFQWAGTSKMLGSVKSDGPLVVLYDIPVNNKPKPLRFEGSRLEVELLGDAIALEGLEGKMFEGALKHAATWSLSDAENPLKASFDLDAMKLQEVLNFFEVEKEMKGDIAFDFQASGKPSLSGLVGDGVLKVENGEFYSVPLLGPINMLLDPLVPGVARDKAKELNLDFALQGGVLKAKSLEVLSTLTKISGQGDYVVESQEINADVNANFTGLVGAATAILSKALEIEAKGLISKPRLRLKNLPVNDLIKAGVDVTKLPADLLKGVPGVGEAGQLLQDGVGGAVEGAGKAVEGVLEGAKSLVPGL